MRILIAEDDKIIQAHYKLALQGEVYELKFATECEQAIAAYEGWRPDIVLLDYGLPLCNGYQILRYIREIAKDKTTTVIMVSSISDQDIVIACSRLGIQGYIVKPFKTKEIAWMINRYHHDHQKEIDL